MITVTSFKRTYNPNTKKHTNYREGTCLSTDTKPTNWDNGSILLEINTSKVFIYDAENEQWREW